MRRKTKNILVGKIGIGSNYPVSIQTMWDKPLSDDFSSLLAALARLERMGCSLVRFAVPDEDQAKLLNKLSLESSMTLVADIHFDYKLALSCMDSNIKKIRINPGNIGAGWKVEEVIKKAIDSNVALRFGANAGSLPSKLKKEENISLAMVKAVEDQLELVDKYNFRNIIVSLKASSIDINDKANRLFAEKYDYPLHLGITEAGPLIPAIVKSSLGLGRLLSDGIGDTIRISISDSPFQEVMTARELLSELDIGERAHVRVVSCPKCGRTSFDTHAFTEEISDILYSMDKNITVAIMGCMVNGPGEASHADLGITGYNDKVAIFKNGEIIRREPLCKARDVFLEELQKL